MHIHWASLLFVAFCKGDERDGGRERQKGDLGNICSHLFVSVSTESYHFIILWPLIISKCNVLGYHFLFYILILLLNIWHISLGTTSSTWGEFWIFNDKLTFPTLLSFRNNDWELYGKIVFYYRRFFQNKSLDVLFWCVMVMI